jgi:putative oxidoreductase
MDIVELIGRLVFAGLFLFYAVQHATQFQGYAAFAGSRGTPFPRLSVALTGVMLAGGGSLVALGLWADLGALILVVFLVPVAFVIHPFWRFEGQERAGEQGVFLKDLALGGAALALMALSHDGLAHALSGPLFS